MAKMKKHMTHDEEFQIMKLVLDKFLWLGTALLAFGFYKMIRLTDGFWQGFSILVAGALVLIIFIIILVREYNFISH